ncbi:MAG TPA: response regulator [Thermoanaerobaculia bacterium]|nr:response regulator [Thermoanaerobaculia bacterium]
MRIASIHVLRPLRQIARLWPFGRKRVLVLEDDTMMQKLVGKLLRSRRVRVDVFGNGRDVVREIAIKGELYDALLLDLMMPHDGGLTVLRHLREHHASLLGRVILMTGSGSGITDPWSPLVFAVVHKPFDGSALLTTVRACFRQPESLVAA